MAFIWLAFFQRRPLVAPAARKLKYRAATNASLTFWERADDLADFIAAYPTSEYLPPSRAGAGAPSSGSLQS
jgi:hypothetical protein